MWPHSSDEQLLEELSVVVNAGWELPSRLNRQVKVRHLLLLVGPASSTSYSQTAQRFLLLLDEVLRDAPDRVMSEDDRTGCRILLGVHPTYRSVASPTRRRSDAADFLVPGWHAAPPTDRAGTFQRRHQQGALRQVLECLRHHFGNDKHEDEHDVGLVRRWYDVGADRQVVEQRDYSEYRVRRDGLTSIELVESELESEGLVDSDFSVEVIDGQRVAATPRIDVDPTRPGYRRITVDLPREYDAGEVISIEWRERLRFDSDAPNWWRYWVSTAIVNDDFDLDMTVRFADDLVLPDLCWWFSAEPITDLNEIGPNSLSQLIDIRDHRVAMHAWRSTETERRRVYGLIWVWLDDEDSRRQWQAARTQLEATSGE